LPVSDLAISARWYADLFDLELANEFFEDDAVMMSRNGGSEQRATALLRQMCDRQHQDLTFSPFLGDRMIHNDSLSRPPFLRL
jgi:hypothetical protein